MKIALINPPHTAIGSRLAGDHLPPLGLLSVGGPLLDAGYSVELIDADLSLMSLQQIVEAVHLVSADIIMIGHSGSSSVHATVVELCRKIKRTVNGAKIIYGGVYPTYHWNEILTNCKEIDIVIRGEGELTALLTVNALHQRKSLLTVRGIAFRANNKIVATKPAYIIDDLDKFRVGWELVDHENYSYWGGKRAVVVQFSRGCPYLCNYCGQRGFWTQWRHRNPVLFAQELARLHREYGVEVINFADELPTRSRREWKIFLETLIAEEVSLLLVGSTRASDIVRDENILHLYKKAGIIRFLLGIESYNKETLENIDKGSGTDTDKKAIKLLQKHGIIAMATYVVGFFEKDDKDYWNSFKNLLKYDPDQIQLVYATPHRWTPFYSKVIERRVIQKDTRLWDYKHQVIESAGIPPWRVFFWFKLIEVMMQARPKVIKRMLFHPSPEYRYAMRWYTKIGRRVWFHEVMEFLFRIKTVKNGPSLKEFMGESLNDSECSMVTRKKIMSD